MVIRQYKARVIAVTEKFENKNFRKVRVEGEDHWHWAHDQVSLGWFVWFEGSRESLNFGCGKPDVAVGDVFLITMEKIET